MASTGVPQRLPAGKRRRFALLPTTRMGTWAVWLAVAHVVLMFSWSLLGRLGGVPGLILGLAAGVVALVAIIRRRERAATVFASVLPLLTVVGFVLAELLIGHA